MPEELHGATGVGAVIVGVDTHKDLHVAVAVDGLGRRLGEHASSTDPAGLKDLLRWAHELGPGCRWGIEGTSSYGAGLSRVLQAAGASVHEVCRPNRRVRRTRGKSDPIDAEAAARAGTSTLFASLEIATGKVTAACKPRHRHQEFLAFLKQVARAYPDRGDGQALHLVLDNYATHKKVEVRGWLAANPRIHVHNTATSGSWLNLAEVWFGIIERQAIHRGSFGSVRDLNAKIRAFIDGWNDRCHPFVWTRSPNKSSRKPTVSQLQTRATSPALDLLARGT
nr:IS630 family transposase [Humibacillus sp. DSM 29435]